VVGTVDTKLEQVYTAYNGHLLKHRDFGLKRTLPRKQSARSPWVRLKALDTAYRQTDYRSAAPEASLVHMWRQIEVGVKTARKNHAAPTLAPDPRPIRIEFSWFDHPSRDAVLHNANLLPSPPPEKARFKHIWHMHQSQFNSFVDLMRTKRDAFKQFLQDKHNTRPSSDAQEGGREWVDLYEYAQGNPDQIRRDMEEFVQQVAEKERVSKEDDKILPMPHPNLGLSYGHFDQLHNERLTGTIAGRVLDEGDVKASRQTVSIAGMVGTLQRASHMDLASTSFEADVNGYHNLEQGKGGFRIESAHMDPYHLPTEFQFQGFNSPLDQPVRWLDPANHPRALAPNRLKLVVREARNSDALLNARAPSSSTSSTPSLPVIRPPPPPLPPRNFLPKILPPKTASPSCRTTSS